MYIIYSYVMKSLNLLIKIELYYTVYLFLLLVNK